MSTSTNAVLFYGYHLSESLEVPDAAADAYLTDAPVQVDYHCSPECAMPHVFLASSRTTARRGYPEELTEPSVRLADREQADRQIREFAEQHGLPLPGEVIDPDWPDDKASRLGWWLVSWWG